MKLFDEFDALTGRIKRFDYEDGRIIQRTTQDVAPLLDANLIQRNDPNQTRDQIKRGMWKVGSIPLELAQKWKAEEGFDVMTAPTHEVLKRLRDADYYRLRTTDAKF